MIVTDPEQSPRAADWGRLLTLLVVIGPFAAVLIAIHQLWQHEVNAHDLVLCGIFYVLTSLGICVGFHRLLTHRSFAAIWPVRCGLLVLGSLAVEGPVVHWVATHLQHHARSDRPGDPHSPRDGFWHAHVGWMLGSFSASPEIYARHLRGDRLVQAVSRTFFGWVAVSLALPALLDGWWSADSPGGFSVGFWHGLLWGGLVRICLAHHVTWSVNSICHSFGRRPFAATQDCSRNNWVVGLLAFGEGWHNNHHAFPSAAYHGFAWWQIDISGYVIRLFALLRFASRVQMPSPEAVARQRRRGEALNAERITPQNHPRSRGHMERQGDDGKTTAALTLAEVPHG